MCGDSFFLAAASPPSPPSPPPAAAAACPPPAAAASATYRRAPGRAPCPYGARCYRTNPAHFVEADHPADHPLVAAAAAAPDAPVLVD